jgi:hypothetical protein
MSGSSALHTRYAPHQLKCLLRITIDHGFQQKLLGAIKGRKLILPPVVAASYERGIINRQEVDYPKSVSYENKPKIFIPLYVCSPTSRFVG